MTAVLKTFDLKTKAYCDIINITDQVQHCISNSDINDGIVTVHIAGSTGAISTVEFEPGLVKHDIKNLLEKLIPYNDRYKHHETWHDYNGAGHLRSFLIKTSQVFPFKDQKLILGTWQQIIFIECDEKARSRRIYCMIVGD